MSAKERMQVMQAALKDKGVVDVKFCFAPTYQAKPSSDVVGDAVNFLEAYNNGRRKVVPRVGDAPIAAD